MAEKGAFKVLRGLAMHARDMWRWWQEAERIPKVRVKWVKCLGG